MPRQDWIRQIRARAPAHGVDPRAALAVANAEGLSGAVGDSGHAFGPFQLNDAGGVLTGRPGDHRAFAESPAGIDWALSQIGQVAGGLTGRSAIDAIVRKFERPANPDAEVGRANSYYGQIGGGAPVPSSPGVPAAPAAAPAGAAAPDIRRQLALALLQQNQTALAGGTPNYQGLLGLAMRARTPQAGAASGLPGGGGPATAPAAAPTRTPQTHTSSGGGAGIAELFYDPLGAIKYGQQISPIGGHSDHVHFAAQNPQEVLGAIQQAQQLGLRVSENPYVGDTVDPVHATNSFHYRTFPGQYGGKQLGEAFDASGTSNQMAALYRALLNRYR